MMLGAVKMAKDIAEKSSGTQVSRERLKVNVIREKRVVEYAR